MKYIDAERVIAEIDIIIDGLKKTANPNPLGTMNDLLVDAELETLDLVKTIIKKIKQENPTPTGIDEESRKQGWLSYGLIINEIGLHRYNAQHRINEHRDKFNAQAIPDLYHVIEYYKNVGSELTCCCLQAYCKDFMFTQNEVKHIIKKGQT